MSAASCESAMPLSLIMALPGADTMTPCAPGTYSIAPWPGCASPEGVPQATTPRREYIGAISRLVDSLRQNGGKTVIARTICGDLGGIPTMVQMRPYFDSMPGAFRFVFSTSAGVTWMGASPELLLESVDGGLRTRALAGTRPAGTPGPWSRKNIEEHRIVVDDMLRRLADLGVGAQAEECRNLRYGRIEHLCTDIFLPAQGRVPYARIAAALHPTAAVGGYPRQGAMDAIAAIESTPRRYYGGTITVEGPRGPVSYVVLRTLCFDSRHWCIYTGSGITADSDPADEWEETRAKARPLLDWLGTLSGGSKH